MPESIPGAIISFPLLGESFSLNPSSTYTLFGRTFYWYGVIIGLGFLIAVLYCLRRCQKSFGVSQDNLTDVVLLALPSAIVGARLYYVACNWQSYAGETFLATLWNIAKIWEGGTAIFGGLVLAVGLVALYCRKKKISLGAVLDLCAFGLLIGQSIGRWANFINREAFGFETEIFCRMGLTAGGQTWYVHPLFLYESLWNLLGFVLLHLFDKKGGRKYDGQLFLLYLAWYGFGRFFLEMLRTQPLLIPGTDLMASQVIAGFCVLFAAVMLVVLGRRPHPPENLWVNQRLALAAEAAAAASSATAQASALPSQESAPVPASQTDVPADEAVNAPEETETD